MTTEVFCCLDRRIICPKNQIDPAAIPDVRASASRARYFAKIIWNGAVTGCAGVQMPAGMTPSGGQLESDSSPGIRCVWNA